MRHMRQADSPPCADRASARRQTDRSPGRPAPAGAVRPSSVRYRGRRTEIGEQHDHVANMWRRRQAGNRSRPFDPGQLIAARCPPTLAHAQPAPRRLVTRIPICGSIRHPARTASCSTISSGQTRRRVRRYRGRRRDGQQHFVLRARHGLARFVYGRNAGRRGSPVGDTGRALRHFRSVDTRRPRRAACRPRLRRRGLLRNRVCGCIGSDGRARFRAVSARRRDHPPCRERSAIAGADGRKRVTSWLADSARTISSGVATSPASPRLR